MKIYIEVQTTLNDGTVVTGGVEMELRGLIDKPGAIMDLVVLRGLVGNPTILVHSKDSAKAKDNDLGRVSNQLVSWISENFPTPFHNN